MLESSVKYVWKCQRKIQRQIKAMNFLPLNFVSSRCISKLNLAQAVKAKTELALMRRN